MGQRFCFSTKQLILLMQKPIFSRKKLCLATAIVRHMANKRNDKNTKIYEFEIAVSMYA